MHMCLCIQNLQPAFVYITVSCCTTDISAPKSDSTHPAEIAHVAIQFWRLQLVLIQSILHASKQCLGVDLATELRAPNMGRLSCFGRRNALLGRSVTPNISQKVLRGEGKWEDTW